MDYKKLFDLLIHSGDTVLDVGAHEGDVAAYFAGLVGPTGHVAAFEPNRAKYRILCARLKNVSNCRSEPLAVTSYVGTVPFYYGTADFADMASTIVVELANEQRLGSDIHKMDVECTTIDVFCRRNALRPSFIKIDIEGAEQSVLDGATETIKAFEPYIYFEAAVDREVPSTVHHLRKMGYRVDICDMSKFVNRAEMSWEPGKFLISDVAALKNAILTFKDDELLECAPLLANMIAVPLGRDDDVWGGTQRMALRDGVQLMRPYVPSGPERLAPVIRRILPEPAYRLLRRAYHALGRRS
jgi:FkbM family methyltransferase